MRSQSGIMNRLMVRLFLYRVVCGGVRFGLCTFGLQSTVTQEQQKYFNIILIAIVEQLYFVFIVVL